MSEALAVICVLVWLYLIAGRGAFWLGHVRDTDRGGSDQQQWPAVVAVVPARNESDYITASVRSLLRQDYAGPLSIVVVDDDSSDDTADKAASQVTAGPPGDSGQRQGPTAGMDRKIVGAQSRALMQPKHCGRIICC